MTPNPGTPQPAKKSNASLFIIIGVLAVGGCCFFGILAAIAIPSFVRYQGRAKQAEVKSSMKAIYAAQKSRFAEVDAYSTDVTELGLAPGTRFTCFVTPTSFTTPTVGPAVKLEELQLGDENQPGVVGDCPSCEFTAVCAGNVDQDPTFDIWSISSANRECAPAGVPCIHVDDMEQ